MDVKVNMPQKQGCGFVESIKCFVEGLQGHYGCVNSTQMSSSTHN